MKATVYAINHRRGMVAVQTESDDFSTFELLGSAAIDVGDKVSWKDDTSLGSTLLMNKTKSSEFEVYFQNHWVPKHLLRKQLMID